MRRCLILSIILIGALLAPATSPAQIVRTFSRIADLADAPKIGGGKLVFVDAANGNDATALRGRRELPFLTCAAAKAAALSGDTIHVQPGTYNETNLAKNGVSWHFETGASIAYVAVLTDATPVPGIFDDGGGAMTFAVTGDPVLSMTITESAPNVANHIDVYAISLTAASTVRIKARSINCDTTLRNGILTIHTGHSLRQTAAATLLLDVEDPNDVTISAGTARIITRGTNATVTANGGTVDVLGSVLTTVTCSSGSLCATFDKCATAACSGGTMRLNGERVDSLNWSGGELHADPIAHVGHLAGTAASGTGYFRVGTYGDGTNEGLNFADSGTAVAYVNGGSIQSTAAPCATFAGGKIRARDMDIRCTAPTGSHGTDIAIGAGDVAGVNTTDLTLTNMLVRVNDSTHSAWRVYSEDPAGSKYRVIGGVYQAGTAGFWFDPEAACALTTMGATVTNRAAGPFATVTTYGTVTTNAGAGL